MRRAITLLSVLVLASGAVPAGASTRAVRDPRDTKGPLDIRRIAHGHPKKAGDRAVRHVIETHRSWRKNRIRCGGQKCHGIINIDFSTDRDLESERLIQIYARGGVLHAPVLRHAQECAVADALCVEKTERIGHARVFRSSRRSIGFVVPLRLLGHNLKRYLWRVTLAFGRAKECPENSGEAPKFAGGHVCLDYAPEKFGRPAWLRHRLR